MIFIFSVFFFFSSHLYMCWNICGSSHCLCIVSCGHQVVGSTRLAMSSWWGNNELWSELNYFIPFTTVETLFLSNCSLHLFYPERSIGFSYAKQEGPGVGELDQEAYRVVAFQRHRKIVKCELTFNSVLEIVISFSLITSMSGIQSSRQQFDPPTPTCWHMKWSRDVCELVFNPVQLVRS